MVVKAGVVVVRPADQPDVEVLVAQQLLVGPLQGIVLDVLRPERRPRRDLARDDAQLPVGQVVPARPGDLLDALDRAKPPSRPEFKRRRGFVLSSARPSAAPRTGAWASTTGRSEP